MVTHNNEHRPFVGRLQITHLQARDATLYDGRMDFFRSSITFRHKIYILVTNDVLVENCTIQKALFQVFL